MQLIFSVFDSKAEIYLPPFNVPAMGIATRAFADCVNSDSHEFGKHPADYTLFQLGTFDDISGEIVLSGPKSVGNGLEYVETDYSKSLGEHRNASPNTPIFPDENSGDPPV